MLILLYLLNKVGGVFIYVVELDNILLMNKHWSGTSVLRRIRAIFELELKWLMRWKTREFITQMFLRHQVGIQWSLGTGRTADRWQGAQCSWVRAPTQDLVKWDAIPGWPGCALRKQEIGSIWLGWWMCGEEKIEASGRHSIKHRCYQIHYHPNRKIQS